MASTLSWYETPVSAALNFVRCGRSMPISTILPFEIWCIILADLDRTSLRSLSLVSRALHVLAEPFLYADINWEWQEDHYYNGIRPRLPQDRLLQRLLRTFAKRPELALLVKRVQLGVDFVHVFGDSHLRKRQYLGGALSPVIDGMEPELAMDVVHRMGFPQKSSWYNAFNEGSPDVLIALMLSQLENLQTLQLEIDLIHRSVFIGIAFQHRICRFRRLQHVYFYEKGHDFRASGLKAPGDQILSLFSLPSVQSLELTLHSQDLGPPCSLDDLSAGPKSLRALSLSKCNLHPDHVASLLRLTPALKELHCGLLFQAQGNGNGPSTNWLRIDFSKLNSTLSVVADTLEALEIVAYWDDNDLCKAALDRKQPLGSIKHFHRLSRLELPIEFILEPSPWHGPPLSEQLPPSLRSLCLVDNASTWTQGPHHRSLQPSIDLLREYLHRTNRPSHAPFLRQVTMKHLGVHFDPLSAEYYNRRTSRPTELRQLRAIAEASGGVMLNVLYLECGVQDRNSYSVRIIVYDPARPNIGPFLAERLLRPKLIFSS